MLRLNELLLWSRHYTKCLTSYVKSPRHSHNIGSIWQMNKSMLREVKQFSPCGRASSNRPLIWKYAVSGAYAIYCFLLFLITEVGICSFRKTGNTQALFTSYTFFSWAGAECSVCELTLSWSKCQGHVALLFSSPHSRILWLIKFYISYGYLCL